jgi:hypothetical protein
MKRALALLFAALATSAAAATPAISAAPATLRLGEGARATLRVLAAEPPRLVASAGRVEGLRPAGDGAWEAEYVPPAEAYPQVALVAALVDGGCAWTAIPLVGSGEAVVRTSPGARIEVTIGEETFGPARADGRGIALVPVRVPPGVTHAVHRGQRIDLGVPPVAHVAVVAAAARVRADEDRVVTLHALAVTPDGRPRAGAPLALAASAGAVSPPAEIAPGVFEARWRLAAGAAGPVTVAATLGGEEVGARAVVLRDAGPPARVRVEPDRAALAPGDGALRVRARVEDAAGNPVADGAEVAATFGAVSRWEAVGPGAWEGRLDVPASRGGRDALALKVRSGAAEGERVVALVPGPATGIELEPAGGALERRRRRTRLAVAAVDAHGNAVDVGAPAASAGAGALAAPAPIAPGRWALAYRAPGGDRAAVETITVRAGGMERVARFELVPPRREREASARAGLGAGRGGVRGSAAGLELAGLGRLRGALVGAALDASALAASWSSRGDAGGRALRVEGAERAMVLQGSAIGRARLGPGTLGLAAGGGLARVATELTVEAQPGATATAWTPAATAALSYRLRAGPGLAVGELRAQRIFDPGSGAVRGDLDLLTLSVGYAIGLL